MIIWDIDVQYSIVARKIKVHVTLLQCDLKLNNLLEWLLQKPIVHIVFDKYLVLYVSVAQNLFIFNKTALNLYEHLLLLKSCSNHAGSPPTGSKWRGSLEARDSNFILLYLTVLGMLLKLLFEHLLGTEFALKSHWVVNNLFILFKSFYFIFLCLVLFLHFQYLLGESVIHGC